MICCKNDRKPGQSSGLVCSSPAQLLRIFKGSFATYIRTSWSMLSSQGGTVQKTLRPGVAVSQVERSLASEWSMLPMHSCMKESFWFALKGFGHLGHEKVYQSMSFFSFARVIYARYTLSSLTFLVTYCHQSGKEEVIVEHAQGDPARTVRSSRDFFCQKSSLLPDLSL